MNGESFISNQTGKFDDIWHRIFLTQNDVIKKILGISLFSTPPYATTKWKDIANLFCTMSSRIVGHEGNESRTTSFLRIKMHKMCCPLGRSFHWTLQCGVHLCLHDPHKVIESFSHVKKMDESKFRYSRYPWLDSWVVWNLSEQKHFVNLITETNEGSCIYKLLYIFLSTRLFPFWKISNIYDFFRHLNLIEMWLLAVRKDRQK